MKQATIITLTILPIIFSVPYFAFSESDSVFKVHCDKDCQLYIRIAKPSNDDFDLVFAHRGDGFNSIMEMFVTDKVTGHSLASRDISHPFYAGLVGIDKTYYSNDKEGRTLILLSLRYGGDGDHTEDRLLVHRFNGKQLEFVADENLMNPEIIEKDGILQSVKGLYVLSLCDVCDGWDAGDEEDAFIIPVTLTFDGKGFTRVCRLSEEEKDDMLKRFRNQRMIDDGYAKEYKDERYLEYSDKVEKELLDVLGRNI